MMGGMLAVVTRTFLGLAQWNDRGKWIFQQGMEHTGEKWSRQSEELLHRVLDLTILVQN